MSESLTNSEVCVNTSIACSACKIFILPEKEAFSSVHLARMLNEYVDKTLCIKASTLAGIFSHALAVL